MDYVKILFDDLAKRYDFFCEIASFFLDRFWRKKINHFIHQEEVILDLGTGTGELAFGINKARGNHLRGNHLKKIIGIDFSWEMLKNAQRKKNNEHSAVEFIAANAQKIPFQTESFNSVVSSFVFRHLQKNIKIILEEIYRVIKPEGKIVILEFGHPEFAFSRKIYYLYLEKIVPLIGRILFGKEKVKYFHYLKETIMNFFPPEELRMILSHAGFRKVKYYPLIGGVIGIYYGFK